MSQALESCHLTTDEVKGQIMQEDGVNGKQKNGFTGRTHTRKHRNMKFKSKFNEDNRKHEYSVC